MTHEEAAKMDKDKERIKSILDENIKKTDAEKAQLLRLKIMNDNIKKAIEIWKTGCSVSEFTESQHPAECHECTQALIDVIYRWVCEQPPLSPKNQVLSRNSTRT